MLNSSDPRYQYCARVGKSVCLKVECRLEHGCIKPNRPLGTTFGLQAFDERMRAFATTFDLWPLGGGDQPDFP
jgi:hypothetical protein